jgi:hypothetical protein
VLDALDEDERRKPGSRLQAVEKMAPTHPHPTAAGSTTAVALTGRFAAMVDRVQDALSAWDAPLASAGCGYVVGWWRCAPPHWSPPGRVTSGTCRPGST